MIKLWLNKGIGLIEILLVLTIVAVIFVLATRYYSSANQAQKVQAAVDQVNAVRGAMQNAVVGSNINLGYVPQIGKLVSLGFLPPSFVGASSMSAAAGMTNGINPWGGNIYVQHNPGLLFKVIMDGIPSMQTCQMVQSKLLATSASPKAAHCNDDTGDGSTGGASTSQAATLNAQYLF